MSQRDWTAARIDLLRRHHAKGTAYAEIARRINEQTGSGFTRNACIGKALRIGLAVKRAKPSRQHVEKPRKAERPARFQPHIKRSDYGSRLPVGGPPPDLNTLTAIETAAPPAEFLAVTLFDLQPQHCRYPRGGNDGEPILFCGQPKIKDSSYCAHCHARCHGGRPMNISDEERARRSAWAALLSARRRTGRAA